jgi:hypothetical protein
MLNRTYSSNKQVNPSLRQTVTYRLIPPAFRAGNNDPNRLYSLIYELLTGSEAWRSGGNNNQIALEAVVSGEEGLLLLVTAPLDLGLAIKEVLIAFEPKLKITRLPIGDGYRLTRGNYVSVSQWSTRADFPNPLLSNAPDTIINGLRRLRKNELVGWQVLITPDKLPLFKTGTDLLMGITSSTYKAGLNTLYGVAGYSRSTIPKFLTAASTADGSNIATKRRYSFRVCLRSITSTPEVKRVNELKLSLDAAITAHGFKQLHTRADVNDFNGRTFAKWIKLHTDGLSVAFDLPTPGGKWEDASELNFTTGLGLSIANRTNSDIVLGKNTDGEVSGRVYVGLSAKERQKHTLVIGGTGMGKSTLLAQAFIQDMKKGRGAALIDPHGDLAADLLNYVPKNRVNDVIYLDPAQVHHPVSVNLMELPTDLPDSQLSIARDFICEAIISIFRKVFSDDDSGGHRIEYILRNAVYTAFNVPDATLFTLLRLLTNDRYRAYVVSRLNDEGLKDFWYGEFNKAGSYQRVKMSSGVTAKLGRFERSIIVRRMLEKPRSTINFKTILESNKILICNLSKGGLGEDTASLLGMVLLAKLQLAAWSRSRVNPSLRNSFYLYVDEFESYNASIFSQLVSESRKFGLCLTLAEQTTAYQSDKDANIILANVGNVICFRTAANLDNQRLGPVFGPYLSKYDLANLAPFEFYLKAAAEKASKPVSAKTIKPILHADSDRAQQVISASIRQYS